MLTVPRARLLGNFVSCCYFAEDDKEMYQQDSKRTCRAIVLLIELLLSVDALVAAVPIT